MSTLATFQRLELIRSTTNLANTGNTVLAATILCQKMQTVADVDGVLDEVSQYVVEDDLLSMRQLAHIILE